MNSGIVKQSDGISRQRHEEIDRGCCSVAEETAGFRDRYLRGDLEIALVSKFGDGANFGFTVSVGHVGGISLHVRDECAVIGSEGDSCGASLRLDKPSVLPGVVHVMEHPQECVPSAIRPKLFNFQALRWGEPLYEFYPFVIAGKERSFGLGDGKVNIVFVRHAVAIGERRGEDVERAANGIDVRAEFDREGEGYRLFLDSYKKIVSGIRFQVSDIDINVIVEPSLHSLLEGWQVGFGPVN